MYETLMRPHEVSQIPSLKSVRQVSEELKGMAVRREERRLRQIATSAASRTKRKRQDDSDQLDLVEAQEDTLLKRVKTAEEDGKPLTTSEVGAETRRGDNDNVVGVNTSESTNLTLATDPEAVTDPIQFLAGGEMNPNRWVGPTIAGEPGATGDDNGGNRHLNVSKVFPEVRGHTSYLTFACLVAFPWGATPSAVGTP